ncbi:MAG: Aldo/keto reductase [Chloroflexota bacterium]|nr:Aldo/keto reductase [Chloroflexota bacterium]
MEKRTLIPSGIQLPRLGLGCWSFGGQEGDYWGPHDDREAAEIIARALDSGVNYFDTAEGYNEGRSEAALGRALAGRRHEAIIGTKVSPQNTEPQTLRQHCTASLRRLGADTIDIYMVHWPITDRPVADAFATLADLRAEGKIRAIGISNFGPTQLQEAVATGVPLEVNQLGYSLLNRTIELEILPACRRYGIGVAAYMPLMQGLLTGRWRNADEIPQVRRRTRHFSSARPGARHGEPGAEAEVFAAIAGIARLADACQMPMSDLALAWVAAQEDVTTVIAGTRTVAQLDESRRGIGRALTPDVLAELDRLTLPVKAKLGSNADLWQSGPNRRIH